MRFFIKWLSNIKVAIVLLVLLITCSFIGSIIEQVEKPLNQPFDINQGFWLKNFSIYSILPFSNIFNNFWFFSLNLLLGLSLLLCTFTQQLPSFDFCRSLNFLKNFLERKKFDGSLVFPRHWFPFTIDKMSSENYFLFQKHNSLYASQGLAGRLGPVFVHLSLILILIASFISAISGILAQEFIPKGEIVYLQNFPSNHLIAELPIHPLRVNDFWVNHINGSIHQFYTNISTLYENGKEGFYFTLSVNHPFYENNVIWYQTDWDIIGLKLKLGDSLYQIPITSISTSEKRLWVSWLPFNDKGNIIFFESLRGDFTVVSINLNDSGYRELGQNILNTPMSGKIIDLLTCTGLQVRSDPGQLFLSLGFASLIASTFISYISYSRIWIVKKIKSIQIGGITNRAKLKFDYQLLSLFSSMPTFNNK